VELAIRGGGRPGVKPGGRPCVLDVPCGEGAFAAASGLLAAAGRCVDPGRVNRPRVQATGPARKMWQKPAEKGSGKASTAQSSCAFYVHTDV